MDKLATINVIEYHNNSIQALHSFSIHEEGQKEADELFVKLARENDFSEEEIADGLTEGQLSHSENDYQLFLVHSILS